MQIQCNNSGLLHEKDVRKMSSPMGKTHKKMRSTLFLSHGKWSLISLISLKVLLSGRQIEYAMLCIASYSTHQLSKHGISDRNGKVIKLLSPSKHSLIWDKMYKYDNINP